MPVDPVCGMTVDKEAPAAISEYNGETVYFCAEACKKQFEENPEGYLNGGYAADITDDEEVEKPDVWATPSAAIEEKGKAQLILPIQGMSCASCVKNIEKGLRTVEGVLQASVNFGTEKATVVFDPMCVTPEKLIETVNEVGYTPVVEKVTLPISGMSCASCVQKIENALRDTPGVISANVNFGTEKVTVQYVSSQVGARDLTKAVRDVGYDVLEMEETAEAVDREKLARQKEIRTLRTKLIVGAALSILIFLGSFREWFPWVPPFLE